MHSHNSATSERRQPSYASELAKVTQDTLPAALDGKSLQGRIKGLVSGKMFGFIGSEGMEFFFHASATTDFDSLEQGDLVSFMAIAGKGGLPKAVKVRKVKEQE